MSQTQKKDYVILAGILIFGFLLRIYHLDTYSIFFDEKSTMLVSQGIVLEGANQKDVFLAPTFTPAQFWSHKSIDDYYEAMTRSDIGNSPFYYLLLHIWMDIFGLSDFSARFFSVIFSMLIIGATYFFGRRFFSSNTGLIAAAIVAVEPIFIAYSHQARNYSLTFLLTLLATHFFLQIIEDKADRRSTLPLYVGYILTSGLGLLSHFLTISVLLTHGIYALLFLRSISGWIKMAISGVLSLSGITWWLLFGGGKYTLFSLNHQAVLYKKMADTNDHTFGVILPATVKNVFLKSVPLFTDLIVFTNGLTDALVGRKNMILAIGIGIILIIWFRTRTKINIPVWLNQVFPYLLLLAGFLFYSNHRFQFCILSVSIFALSFIYDIHVKASNQQKKRLWLLYLMGTVPTLFLILMSFKNGHTYAINQQRYSGFSFPYVIILLSLLLQYYTSLPGTVRTLVFLFLTIQLYFVGQRLLEFYEDRSPKYGYFLTPRPANPYHKAARKISAIYQKGDTVLYPVKYLVMKSEMDRTFLPYSVMDAQITNLYLPKDAQFVQRVDTTQTDRILIKRNGKKLEIMNLKGQRAGND